LKKKENMLRSLRQKGLLAAAAVAYMVGQTAFANTDPGVQPRITGSQFFDAPTSVGLDGNIRVLWDLFNTSGGAAGYTGSTLWICDSKGNILAFGKPTVPAWAGYSLPYNGTTVTSTVFGQSRSNIILKGQKDGNTTLVIVPYNFNSTAGGAFVVWTYNSAGALISSAIYGPYQNEFIQDIRFAENGKIIVQWISYVGMNQTSNLGWTLNEFGSIETFAGPYGPYGTYLLGKIDIGPDNGQRWYWVNPPPVNTFNQTFQAGANPTTLAMWTFAPGSSNVASTVYYGPY
jgi:hypothetical protein